MTLDDLIFVWEGGAGGEVRLDGVIFFSAALMPEAVSHHLSHDFADSDLAVLDRPDTDEGLDDGTGTDTDDWWVVKGKPWICTCGASMPYMAEDVTPHRIIVWPSDDDPNLRRMIRLIAEKDREDASAIRYEASMGACVSFYALEPS